MFSSGQICTATNSSQSAKYPLATASSILNVYGPRTELAFDLGCALHVTLTRSILGPQAAEKQIRLVVDGFHGHAHNRGCQVDFHPQYIVGNGRSDHAGCERVFDSSNELSPTTRHSSRFHRQQAIEQHVGFWDEDKYAQLSKHLSNVICTIAYITFRQFHVQPLP